MVCIYCQSATNVINSRHQRKANHIWRRRKCLNCLAIFTTIEETALPQAVRVTDKGQLDNFEPQKIFISIYESCKHRRGAITEAKFLTDTVINKLWPRSDKGVIDKLALAETILEVLERFDKAAAVHYQVYHPASFK